MTCVRAAWMGLVVGLAVTAASAQTGGMKIRVYDAKDNSPLPGAVVVLSHATGNVAPTTELSDVDGYVVFPVLRAGSGYIIEVSFPGYAKVRLTERRVRLSGTETIPIGMTEAIQEKVEVVGDREIVDLERTETSSRFSDEFIQDLPVSGRFYQNVLTLAPGVSDDDGDGNPNVNGARSRDFKAIVGGVSNVDPFSGEFLNYVNPDSIEEIEVITAGAGVEYGRAQGGFATIVQKQGTNDFEGTFSMYYRSSKLDGTGANKNVPARLFPEFHSYQPGISVSGPILKDKLWYVLSYEYHSDEVPVNTVNAIVVATRVQPIGSGTVTWQASPRNKLAFKYQFDPITATNQGVSSARPQENSFRRELGGPTYSMQWIAPYSPKLLVDSTIAYQDSHSNALPMTNASGEDGILGTDDDNTQFYNQCVKGYDLVAGADCTDVNKNLRTGSFFLTHRDERQRLTVSTQAEIFGGKFWGMSHQFKVGFIVENERYYQFENLQPRATFEVIQDPNRADGDPLKRTGLMTTTFSVPAVSTARATGTTWGMFARDEIKPINNLTLTLGLRYDREFTSSQGALGFDPAAEAKRYVDNATPQTAGLLLQQVFTAYEDVGNFLDQLATTIGVDPSLLNTVTSGITRQSQHWAHRRRPGDITLSNNNVSPFFAASWDPWSDSKTRFTLALGRHYNNIPLNIPALELASASATISFRASPGGTCPAPPAPCPRYEIPVDYVTGLPVSLGGRGGINPAVAVSVVDRDLKTPYQDELSFTFERELTTETLFRLTYIHRNFEDQIQDIDINHAPGDYGRCQIQTDLTVSPIVGSLDDGVPGPGDGILDDCIGKFIPGPQGQGGPDPGGSTTQTFLNRPDGYLDTYVLNPAWGPIFFVGNFNTAEYNGITLALERQLYRGWELNGSYTWSEVIGDAEDFNQELGDDRTTIEDERGFLSYDQTHVIKVNATTITPWGLRLGGAISWQSGYPYSIVQRRASQDGVPPAYQGFGVPDQPRPRLLYPTGQRNDQRNEPYWLVDMRIAKELNLRGGMNLQMSAEIFNLFNQDHLRVLQQRNDITDQLRNFGRRYQLGMKFSF